MHVRPLRHGGAKVADGCETFWGLQDGKLGPREMREIDSIMAEMILP